MRKIFLLAAASALFATAPTASFGGRHHRKSDHYHQDYGGHYRHGHRDWSGSGDRGHAHNVCWSWDGQEWHWVCH